MYLCALCHAKAPLLMLFLRHQGPSVKKSHFQFLQLNLNNDSWVIKCPLSFSAHCHFPLRAARLRYIFTALSSYRLCSPGGDKKPLCCSDPAGQLWLGSLSTLGRKPPKSTELTPAKRDQKSRAKLCKPNPALKGLYNSCKGTVALKSFTKGCQDFFLPCILQCVVRGQQSPAKPKLLTL